MAVRKDVPQDPEPFEGAVDPAPAASAAASVVTSARRDSLMKTMREHFAKEKRVRVKVKNDSPVPVQINGYSFLIRENVWVEVPESVANLLDEAGYI